MDAQVAQNEIDAWNDRYPIGTRVLSYPARAPRGGIPIETTTRSKAWLYRGTAQVVLIHGRAGFVTLDSLEVPQAAEQPPPPTLSALVNALIAEWIGASVGVIHERSGDMDGDKRMLQQKADAVVAQFRAAGLGEVTAPRIPTSEDW